MENPKLKAALFGGVLLGILSIIPLLNICCCLWVLLGGALSARLLIDGTPHRPVSNGEGASVGVMAGGIGAGIYLLLGIPINLLMHRIFNTEAILRIYEKLINNPAIVDQMRRILEEQGGGRGSLSWLLFLLLTTLLKCLLIVAFSSVGGILGVAIFEKRKGTPPQAPPGAPLYG